VGKNFAWNGEQCDWPVAATVCYGAFAFVQRDDDPVLPVSGNVACSPDTSKEEVQGFRNWSDGTLQGRS